MQMTLDHRYRLLGVIGEGGASVVYRALDLQSGELRAVKVLDPSRDRNATGLRFVREARALLSLQHPHILPLFDVRLGEQPYLVMELCGGDTLRKRLQRAGPLPLSEVLAIGACMLDALHFAHSRGVVHRDVKPDNILVRSDGSYVLADFGIAVLAADRSRETAEGLAIGTFAFMAPEQRLDASSVDARADLYALGATLYELATARPAADLFMAQPGSSRWDGLPAAFVDLLVRACRYKPEDRFASARDMAVALHSVARSVYEARQAVPA
ncbi:MAG: serine/threonine protein kinase [Alphaproteobacteria bacterium]|nr:serine/threonine protein kinase [Alphaproteobacteria bacterium]MCB9692456.1 serine/threonine protein kinase [Alphaproteobacteria bacterium]